MTKQFLCKYCIQLCSLTKNFKEIKNGKLVELSSQYIIDCSDYTDEEKRKDDKFQRGNNALDALKLIYIQGRHLSRERLPISNEWKSMQHN